MKKPFSKPMPGDKVEIIVNRQPQQGILLESHDPGVLLLKLKNGYNIGFKKTEISEKKLTGQKPLLDFYLTGGTISSKLDPSTGGVKWLINSNELFSL